MIRSLALVTVILSDATADAQNVLVVDRAAGPFTEITAAVAAANPGDRILVNDSGATPYAAFSVDFGIEVIGIGTTVLVGGCTVHDLAANQAIRLDNLDLVLGTFSIQGGFMIRDCAGSVHVHRLTENSGLQVINSRRVVVSDSSFEGLTFFTLERDSMELVSASVSLYGCAVTGITGSSQWDGGPAVIMSGASRLWLYDTLIEGGEAINAGNYMSCLFGGQPRGDGGNGVEGSGSDCHVVAAGASRITGGLQTCTGTVGYVTLHGSWTTGLSSVRIGPNVVLGPMGTGQSAVAIPEQPMLDAPNVVPLGSTQSLVVSGTSNRSVLVALDQWNDLMQIPGVELPLVLSFRAGVIAITLPAGASVTTLPLTVPNLPFLLGGFAHLQAGTISSTGQLALSNGEFVRFQ